MIGMILGNRYELLKEIGSGGMANVYLAHCRLLNRSVAVKILKSEFVNDKEFLERFNKEAQVAATISSPNIVNVYDVGHDGDIHYIVMEYVEGQTLKEYIDANGMLSWQETVEYAMQICSALDKAHKSGIVHRDIKPQNIIITNDGMLKVTDFGIARATSNETTNMGESTMGSVHYFSPEQARGGYTDAKSDIYSLGIVMYELITGILPFNGESPIAIAIKHMQQKPISPKEFNVSIPLSVESIILKAMSKEQSLRYQSAEEMLMDLNMVMHNPSGLNIVNDIDVDYGNTIKMDALDIEEAFRQASEADSKDSTAGRTVHKEDDKNMRNRNRKSKKSKKKGSGLPIILAVIAAVLVIGLGALALGGGLFSCSTGSTEYTIPNLIGMNYEDALDKYDKSSGGPFEIEVVKEKNTEATEGDILKQNPEGGKLVKGNLKITIWVATFTEVVKKVPDVDGMSKSDAEREFRKNGISVEFKEIPVINKNYIGKVVETDPTYNTELEYDDEIIVAYIGVKGVEMQDLAGIKFVDAKDWLGKNNLVLGKTDPEAPKNDSVVTVVYVEDEDEISGKKKVFEGDIVAEGATILLELYENKDSGEEEPTDPTNPTEPVIPEGTTVTPEKPEKPEVVEKTKEITVRLPADKSEVQVSVRQDGKEVYKGKHSGSEGAFSMNVKNSTNDDLSKIEIFFDGELSMEFDVNWR